MQQLLAWLYESPTIRNIVFLVGVLYLLRLMVWLLLSLWSGAKAFFLAGLFRVVDLKSYGWAVVTGASDGIGRCYALELARCGVNVVLVSRSEEKLRNVEKEICVALYLCFDWVDMFQMTKMILPDMVDKRRGIVVNVSSIAAAVPHPLLNVYAASKIFLDYFTTSLRYEYSNKGIIIQNLVPGAVATRMTGIKVPRFFAPSATKYSHDAMATIGIQDYTYGTFSHALQMFLLERLPEWFIQWGICQHLLRIRKRSIYKRERRAQETAAAQSNPTSTAQ